MTTLFLAWGGRLWGPDGPLKADLSYSFTTDWTPSGQETFRDIPPAVIDDAAGQPAPRGSVGAAPTQMDVLERAIPPGFMSVVGLAGSGKTTLLSVLEREQRIPVLNWGEPDPWAAAASLPLLSRALSATLTRPELPGIAIDSFKHFLISADSNLGKGGISKAPLLLANDLARIFARAGKHLIANWNPYDLAATDFEAFSDAYAAVSTSVVRLRGGGNGADTINGQIRTRTGAREWTSFRFHVSRASSPASGEATGLDPSYLIRGTQKLRRTTKG